MAVVKEIHRGSATVYIHDDCCKDTTPEEVKAILERIAKITLPYVREAMFREMEAEEKTD